MACRRDRAGARSPAAMWGGKGLMQVVVHEVDAEFAGAEDARKRVHVGSVSIDEPTTGVHQADHLLDLLLEEAQRIWIGDHEPGDPIVARRVQASEVDIASCIGGDLDGDEACHRG